MSVYNRKMFKRNARNALNQQAGVPSFQSGGSVQTQIVPINVGANTMLSQPVRSGGTIRTSVPAYSTFTSPLTNKTYRSRTPSGQGITSLQPFDIARRYIEGGRTVGYGDDNAISPDEYALLQASQSATLTGDFIQDPTNTRVGGILADISRPFAQAGLGTVGYIRGLGEQGLQYALSSPDGPGEDTFGGRVAGLKPAALDDDYLASMGINVIDPDAYSAPIGPQPAPPPPKPIAGGPTYPQMRLPDGERDYLRRQEEAVRAMAKDDPTGQGMVYYDEQTGEYKPGMPTDIMEAQLEANFAEREAGAQQLEEQIRAAQEKRKAIDTITEAENAAAAATEGGETPSDGTDASGDPSETGSTGTPTTPEEISKVINEGTPEEQEKTLDGFIQEFMDKAPGYEGADTGLTLAKIGFAMASGKSPNAIQNISAALEQGADTLIKDKAKKDEFNRQLKLSALQYGLQESGKLDAQRRLDDRNFIRLAATDDVTYNGKTYKKGRTIRFSTTDLLESGGQLPEGFTDVDVYLDGEKAVRDRLKTNATATDALRKELLLSDEAARKIQTDYGTAAKRYIDAEVGIEFTEKALLNLAEDGSITGIKGGVKALANNLANAGGLDLGRKYENKAQFEADVRKAFQKLIPVSLGGVQSANSISNRDVQFLADAYIESAILDGGIFNLAMVDEDVLAGKLGNVVNEFRRNQGIAANEMAGIEGRLANRILPGQGQGSGLNLLTESKKSLEPYGVGQRTTMGLEDTGRKNDQGMPIFRLPSAQ